MNICYIATTTHLSKGLNEALGSTTHTYSIALELSKLGHEVHIISERFEEDLEYEQIGPLHVHRFLRGVVKSSKEIKKKKISKVLKYFKIIPNFVLACNISKIFKDNDCDIVVERAHSLGVGAIVSYIVRKPLILEVIDSIFSKMSEYRAKSIIAYRKKFFKLKNKNKVEIVSAGYDNNYFYPLNSELHLSYNPEINSSSPARGGGQSQYLSLYFCL